MKLPYTPIKVIDTIFESPELWRAYASKQTFENKKTELLSILNPDLFASFASKLIKHCHGGVGFKHLEVFFEKINNDISVVEQGNLSFNIMGIIFLDKNNLENTGIEFYSQPSSKLTMTVQNEFNRCVMFNPKESYKNLGSDNEKLIIKFQGIAI